MAKKRSRETLESFSRELEEELKKIEAEIEKKYSSPEIQQKIEDYFNKYLASSGINKILIIDFILPSIDLKSRTLKIEKGGKEITRGRQLQKPDMDIISSARTRFYQILRAHGAFKIGEKIWAILPGHEKELIKEANEILKKFNRVLIKYGYPPRTVDLIEMYAPTRWIKKKLAETINEYQTDLQDVIEDLKNKELEQEKRKSLASKASKLKRILRNLVSQYKELLSYEEKIKKEQEKRATQYLKMEEHEVGKTKEVEKEEKQEEKIKSISKKEEREQTKEQTSVDVGLPDFSENQKVVIKAKFKEELPIERNRIKQMGAIIYTGLKPKTYRSGTYLIALKNYDARLTREKLSGVAPENSIVKIYYSTGSSKHDYHRYVAYFLVKKGVKTKVELKDKIGNYNIEATLENLVPLELPSEEKLFEVKAELLNKGWKPSDYDPSKSLYYWWVKEKVQDKIKPNPIEPLGNLEQVQESLKLEKLKLENPDEKAKRYLSI